ncbi:Uncharacterized protein APZ42_006266, partial [Daphnia magna]
DTRLLGQIVYGVHSDEAQRKLLQEGATLSLNQALSTLRTAEATLMQAANLRQKDSPSIQQIKNNTTKTDTKSASRSPHPAHQRNFRRGPPAGAPPHGCWNCGAESFHPKSECPANGKECDSCGIMGHFQKVCARKSLKPETAGSIVIGSILPGELIEASVSPADSDTPTAVFFLPDTGASIDAVPRALHQSRFTATPLFPITTRAVTATGDAITSYSTFQATITVGPVNGGTPVLTTIHVLENLQQPVLSKDTQKKLGILPLDYPHWRVQQVTTYPTDLEKANRLKSLMAAHPLIFDGICRPMVGPPCHFQLADGAIPSAMRGSRPVSIPLLPKLKTEL